MIAVDIPQGSLTDLHHLIHPNNSLIFVHIVADPRFLITSQWLKTRKDRSAELSKVYEVRNTKPCSVQLYSLQESLTGQKVRELKLILKQ